MGCVNRRRLYCVGLAVILIISACKTDKPAVIQVLPPASPSPTAPPISPLSAPNAAAPKPAFPSRPLYLSAADNASPFIELFPSTAQSGESVIVRGRNFCPQPACSALTVRVAGKALPDTVTVNIDGTFQTTIIAGQTLGAVNIEVTQTGSNAAIVSDLKTLIVVKPSEDETDKRADAGQSAYPPTPPLRAEPAGVPARPPSAPAILRPAGPTSGSIQLPLNVAWGGRVVAIDVVPTDRGRAAVASESGGLFLTSNTGAIWTHVDALPAFRMSDVKYADTVGKVIIASTIYNSRTANDGGIWRSGDGGLTWLKIYGSNPTCNGGRASTYGIAVVPSRSEVYVGTDCGLAISRDQGLTWVHVSNYAPTSSGDGNPMVIAVAAKDIGGPASIVDICGHYGHRRSFDGGVTWPVSDAFGACPDNAVHALAQSPVAGDTNVLFLARWTRMPILCLPNPSPQSTYEVFESDDAGMTWMSRITRDCSFSRQPFVYAGLSSDGNAAHADVYFSDGVNMHRQTCTGASSGNRCGTSWTNPTINHTDINALAYDPASARHCAMYLGNDASIYNTTPASCGAAWTEVGTPVNGYNALQVYEVQDQVHPFLPTDFYFGTQDNDLWASPDNGISWPGRTGAEGFMILLNHSTPVSTGQTIVWTACADCVTKSGGPLYTAPANWHNTPNTASGPVQIKTGNYIQWGVANPPTNTSQILYVTTDTGLTWTQVHGVTITEKLWGAAQVSGPSSNPTIYQGVQKAGGSWGLWQITNIFGATPVITRADVNGINSIGIYCLGYVCPIVFGIDPINPLHLIAADVGTSKMISTTDGGVNWNIDQRLSDLVTGFGSYLFSQNFILQPHGIQWDPANPNRILVTTEEAGTIESTDNGNSWSRLYDSRRITYGTNLAFDEVHNRVIEATMGRGLWELDTTTGTDVSITVSAAPFVGHAIHYVVTATNLGLLPAVDMHFTIPTPPGTYLTSMDLPDAVSTSWHCTTPVMLFPGVFSCGSPVQRAVGESVRLEFTVRMSNSSPPPGTMICNTAVAVSEGIDPNEANNVSSMCSQTIGDLIVTSGADDVRTSCQGITDDCTLRGAITKVNGLGAEYVNIDFSAVVTPTVNLTGTLPVIAMQGTIIQGFPASPPIRGDLVPSGDGFVIAADEVTIDHLSVYNLPASGADIHILSGRRDEITNNWLGVRPEASGDTICITGTVTRNADIGILVDHAVYGVAAGDPSLFIANNRIGCHAQYGIALSGVSGAVIGANSYGYPLGYRLPNYIGTNTRGVALPNGVGIGLYPFGPSGARNNAILGNKIANNNGAGIRLDGTGVQDLTSTSGNLISGNQVLRNGLVSGAGGIYLSNAAFFNVIGGADNGAGNDIEGNNGNGVSVIDSNANGILGNTIGNLNGFGVNQGHGVYISNGAADWIGGIFYVLGFAMRGNTISGNTGDGVQFVNGTNASFVTGNIIGANISATEVISNWGSGVAIWANSYSNVVGVNSAGQGNVIGGSGFYGVYIGGIGTYSNTVSNNNIGRSGANALPNVRDGITLQDKTYSNVITGGNLLAFNASGIWVTGGAHDNLFTAGTIFKNPLYGILFDGLTTVNNTVDGMTIESNGWAGIGEKNGATNNVWTRLSTFNNDGLGIDVAIPGDAQNIPTPPMPVITQVVNLPGTVLVRGIASPSLTVDIYTIVELYAPAPDPSGFGEGRTYLGSATTDPNGVWEIGLKSAVGGCFTAFQTHHGLIAQKQAYANSSEYSLNTCRSFIPVILKP